MPPLLVSFAGAGAGVGTGTTVTAAAFWDFAVGALIVGAVLTVVEVAVVAIVAEGFLRTMVVPELLSLPLLALCALRVRVGGRSGERPSAVPGLWLKSPRRDAGRVGRVMLDAAVAGRG